MRCVAPRQSQDLGDSFSNQLQNHRTRGGGPRDLPIQPTCFSKTQAEASTPWGLLAEVTAKPRLVPRVLSTSQSSSLSLSLGYCQEGLEWSHCILFFYFR